MFKMIIIVIKILEGRLQAPYRADNSLRDFLRTIENNNNKKKERVLTAAPSRLMI